MTQEEKAKAYDEVVEKLSKLYRDYDSVSNLIDVKEELENILPELKESEDERIRKAIIEIVKKDEERIGVNAHLKKIQWLENQGEHAKFRDSIQVGDKVTRNRDGMLVNLSQLKRVAKPAEKQGEHDMGISEATKQELEDNLNKALEKETPESCHEFLDKQKPADKVDPKFKVGDFIVNDYCMGRVVEITNDAYLLDTEQGIPFSGHSTRLWDITKDAKDGDVLLTNECEEPKIVFILKGNVPKNCVCGYYCYYNIMYPHFATDKEKGCLAPKCEDLIPATKEQRDLLFAKMKESGYEWDADKKELKKIEQKPAWSEEDEEMYTATIFALAGFIGNEDVLDWLKNLKERVSREVNCTTTKEWSEEDDERFESCIKVLQTSGGYDTINAKWLKSLKERYTWKPSDEQMHYLSWIANVKLGDSVVEQEVSKHLNELYEDLLKLKG